MCKLHLELGLICHPQYQSKTNEQSSRNGVVERCCSAGARESSYPATDGEPTENRQVIWGPWTHSLGKEAGRKHPEYYSTLVT